MALASAAAFAVSLVVAISPQAVRSGTGFAVTSDNHTTQIVTAAHVVADATRVVVILRDGSNYTATILARDHIRDAALLSIGTGNRPILAVSQQVPSKNDSVTVIGYPGTHQFAVSGTDLQVIGSAPPIVVDGEVEAIQQRGESIVFKANVGHGDSGAPIIDKATNQVIGITTGTFRAAGAMLEFNGMDLGLSSAGLATVLHPALPSGGAHPPQYVVAIAPVTASVQSPIASFVQSTFVQSFAEQADFVAVDARWAKDPTAICHAADAHAIASVSASADGALVAAGLTVTDCIGNPFYAESQSLLADQPTDDSERVQAALLATQLEADFNGSADGNRDAWISLLRYGFAIAPGDPQYYSLVRFGVGALDANRVQAVMAGGPAAVAGLRRGDVIAAINGVTTKDMLPDDVRSALDRSSVDLIVQRGANKLSKTLRPRKFPELVRMLGYAQ